MNPAFRLAWLPALVVVPRCALSICPLNLGLEIPAYRRSVTAIRLNVV
jgi:hypothetical protein